MQKLHSGKSVPRNCYAASLPCQICLSLSEWGSPCTHHLINVHFVPFFSWMGSMRVFSPFQNVYSHKHALVKESHQLLHPRGHKKAYFYVWFVSRAKRHNTKAVCCPPSTWIVNKVSGESLPAGPSASPAIDECTHSARSRLKIGRN